MVAVTASWSPHAAGLLFPFPFLRGVPRARVRAELGRFVLGEQSLGSERQGSAAPRTKPEQLPSSPPNRLDGRAAWCLWGSLAVGQGHTAPSLTDGQPALWVHGEAASLSEHVLHYLHPSKGSSSSPWVKLCSLKRCRRARGSWMQFSPLKKKTRSWAQISGKPLAAGEEALARK